MQPMWPGTMERLPEKKTKALEKKIEIIPVFSCLFEHSLNKWVPNLSAFDSQLFVFWLLNTDIGSNEKGHGKNIYYASLTALLLKLRQ